LSLDGLAVLSLRRVALRSGSIFRRATRSQISQASYAQDCAVVIYKTPKDAAAFDKH